MQVTLIVKIDETLMIYSVSYFNLGGLEHCFGGVAHQHLPRGDRTGWSSDQHYKQTGGEIETIHTPRLIRF